MAYETPEAALAALHPLQSKIDRVAHHGAPDTVVASFAPTPAQSRFALAPITLRSWLLLEKINSPFLRSGVQPTLSDVLAAYWVLSQPASDADHVISSGDLESAVSAWAESIPVRQFSELSETLVAHIADAFSPTPELKSGTDDDPKVKASGGTA